MLAGIALTLISLWYGQNHGLMPIEASDDAVMVDGLFNTMMTIGTGIFLLVEGVLIVCLFKFRRRPGDETDGPPIEGNIPLEIVWTAIPAVIVLIIGVYSFDVYMAMGGFDPEASENPEISVQVAMLPGEGSPAPLLNGSTQAIHHHHHQVALGIGASPETANNAPDLTVNVLGLQYAWIFTYPDSNVTSGELHVPAGKDVKLNIKAQDVIHAFWLPEFRLKQDAIPGQDSEIRFVPKRPGEYSIVCAELCGPYHGGMVSKIYVQPPDEFDSWLQQQVASQDDATQTVAANVESLSRDRSDAEFLAPYASQLDIDATVLKPLTVSHQHPA